MERGPYWFVKNYARGLLDPRFGMLIWSPFLVVLIPGLREAWRRADDWVRGPAIGAAAYFFLQWTLNRASGGFRFFSYRYPLEPLVAAAPLLLLAYLHWIRPRPAVARVFFVCVAVAVALHAYGAM
jgi:hypothetical protein